MNLTGKLEAALAKPAATDDYDLHVPLAELLGAVGLSEADAGGAVSFTGADPVLPGALRLAGGTSIALAAKSVAVAKIWQLRGGRGQDISMDLRVAPHRLCPFYDKKWELLDGYPPGDPARVTQAFGTDRFYETSDGRWVHPISPYPKLRNDAAALLGVPERDDAARQAIARWNSFELEEAAEAAGVIMPVVRTTEELIATAQYQQVLSAMPPVVVEKIGDSDPEPLPGGVRAPLEGIRALGRAHIIAGAGCGRALALHGADVLNVWDPNEYELPLLYSTSNVGVRSTRLDLSRPEDQQTMRHLLSGADVFYANRRPGYLARRGLDVSAAAEARPGIVHATVTLNGDTGPWAGRVGFDQTAGCLAGVMLLEGENGVPSLPAVPVVNDYVTSWFLELGILRALMLRATDGGSYRVTVSLTRVALWLLSLGILDRDYAAEVAGRTPGHEYLDPQTFTADTALGRYQGVTEQIRMSETPGHYTNPLIPRGSHRPEWR
ncbi:CoA transferase [Amycolatopsis jiangsuensis]|uniref:Crotonobetainyl-CoA:carnitine CoA-transferase CaiB-like acyl-CoA transferase n=1 Tax=Amycolatopsis jiangsuensis TaxID=1181879 RepID=A0A840J3X5_9PSEU|nr:CoA transferase [Amycolatopsis jiangsuensis]MBB4688137.1 crotonobetainyl-CoA:carnitine CoA-transferase CaiB-like acyl-CoA transferase [Amycolatopsis jiangsuensis]